MITIEASPNSGYFRVDGLDYVKTKYVIKYDNIEAVEAERNFSLICIADGSKIVASRGFAEITGVSSWSELLELLSSVGAVSNIPEVDKITNSIITIDYAHHEVHEGSHYNYLDTHDLLKNGNIEHMIVTPDSEKLCHFVVGVTAITSTVLIAVYEGTTFSDTGTVEPAINRNRNFPDNNTSILYEEPTLIDEGSRLSRITLGAGKNSDGGASRDTFELVLKKNTAYLIRVTELNVSATVVNIVFDWYEHTNK